MRAGKLDNVIEIVRPGGYVDDGYGNQVPVGETIIATVRAQIIQASTEEFMRAWGASTERAIIFRLRWLDDVRLSDKVRHDGTDYNLKEVKPIGRRRGLELRCAA
ncbi:phage head closure protein [Nitratireductor aquibiodomus]|uniref:phage head closure protein n=1 Tax=Nitratireductor aquibiodomus TaxID=204799 RepID=UPI0019D32F0C|nr:phage head closure protein [Nitratireductor aquibiodomus]MBN7759996.1 phage head closure protein [Nitratireductor aquibiodomus]